MRRTKVWSLPGRGLRGCALAVAVLGWAGMAQPVGGQQAGDPPPPGVVVAPAVERDIRDRSVFTGRVEAVDRVELAARVTGFLEARLFEEGASVRQGDVLFRIEQAILAATVAEAQAGLDAALADRALARLTYERTATLVERQATSRSELDRVQAELDAAEAAVAAAEAQLAIATRNLDYAEILAPLDGRIGRAAVSVGDLVGPQSGALATVVSVDPVYAVFPATQEQLLTVARDGVTRDSVVVRLGLADGSIYPHPGRIAFADIAANPTTDTVPVRASVPNPEGLLFDGQLVEVFVETEDPRSAVMIPQAAVLLDQLGAYVFVVGDDNVANERRISTGEQREGEIVVADGLTPGERVVVEGLQKVRPGQPVAPAERPAASQ